MNFRPLTPPPSFSENYIADFATKVHMFIMAGLLKNFGAVCTTGQKRLTIMWELLTQLTRGLGWNWETKNVIRQWILILFSPSKWYQSIVNIWHWLCAALEPNWPGCCKLVVTLRRFWAPLASGHSEKVVGKPSKTGFSPVSLDLAVAQSVKLQFILPLCNNGAPVGAKSSRCPQLTW